VDTWHFGNFEKNDFIQVVPVVIEIDRGLIIDITCFSMDIAIEGLNHFKVVNWVRIPMRWKQSANEEEGNRLL
jgi:hypothetical protein